MKVIKIDWRKRDVYEIDIKPTLQGFYEAMECDLINRVPADNLFLPYKDHDLWIDEERLYKQDTGLFIVKITETDGQVFKGHGIICGIVETEDGEDWCDHNADIEKLKEYITFSPVSKK